MTEQKRPSEEHDHLVHRIKTLFFQFDKDHNGILTKDEVHKLMDRLQGRRFPRSQIDDVFNEMDTDCNDVVEIDEFVEWVMCPTSLVQVKETGPAEFFQVESVLRPLFQVYDCDGSGSISMDEFSNLYEILKGSMKIECCDDEGVDATAYAVPFGATKTIASELGIEASAERVFREADDDGDKKVSFAEFVDWMREAVEHSRISKERFVELVVKLASLLQTLLMVRKTTGGSCKPCGMKRSIVEGLEREVKDVCEELFDDEGDPDRTPETYEVNPWKDLPRNISKHGLLVTHMRLEPIDTSVVVNMEIVISPCLPVQKKTHARLGVHKPRWLAKVERREERRVMHKKKRGTRGRKGKQETHETLKTFYYTYEEDIHGHLHWQIVEDQTEYESAYESMERELVFLAAMMTETDFTRIWTLPQVQLGLEKAMELGLISAEQVEEFVGELKRKCATEAYDSFDRLSEKRQSQLSESGVNIGSFEPFEIMRMLTLSGIVSDSSVWKE